MPREAGDGVLRATGRADGQLLRVDLHAHTHHSMDATTTPAELVERALEVGLDRIAVTDHGAIDGAREARELAPRHVVVGQEIRCRCRLELIGLFLSERVPDRLPVEEVVERIRAQGGVIYAPHPFAYAWRPSFRATKALEAAQIVEAFNGRAFLPRWNRLARFYATVRGIPVGAGSDAHFPYEIGRAWTEMPAFSDADGFLEAAQRARPVGHTTGGVAGHVASASLKAARLVGRLGPRARPGYRHPSPVTAQR